MKQYDVAVIGAGAGGLTVAIGLSQAGKKVALIERGRIGGDCTNVGCVPSKTFLDISRKKKHEKADIRSALLETRQRRQIIQDEETPEEFRDKYTFDIYTSHASFVDTHMLTVGDEHIEAKKIVIATGGHARTIEIDGVDEQDIYTNESFFEIEKDIQKLVIIGGGYIGCELAEACANVWAQITLVQRNTALIPREEQQAQIIMRDFLESRSVEVLTEMVPTNGSKKGNKKILTLEHIWNGEQKEKEYDAIFLSIGREPNIDTLGLEKINIEHDILGIKVDRYNRTNQKHIFAIGDCVAGNPQFTHWANNEGRCVIRNILFPYIKSSYQKRILPTVIYTDIEIARVGKTQAELLAKMPKEDFRTITYDLSENDRSRITDGEKGCVIVHFSRMRWCVLGATIVAKNAGEMISVLTSAMENGLRATHIARQIFSYPTRSESIKKVADKFVISSLQNIRADILWWSKKHALQILTACIWITLIALFLHYKFSRDLSTGDIALQLYNFMQWGGVYAAVLYIFAYAIRPVVLFPATLMTFMSGALFGLPMGFVYTMIGENMSANLAYFLGRVFGKDLIQSDRGVLTDLSRRLEKSSFGAILFTRLAFFPFDAVNYASGILRAKWLGFFLATLVGIIPGALVFIIAGASIRGEQITSFSDIQVDTSYLWGALGLFLVTVTIAKILQKKK